VATRSYEHYTEAEIKSILQYNPYSFLHILNPGYKFQHGITGGHKFEMVKNRYLEFKEENSFIKDEKPAYYLYKIDSRESSCFGIIAAASVEDYEKNLIKKHEDTIASRENLFKDYLKVVGFNTEPVLLTYPDSPKLNELLEKVMQTRPEYEFATTNREIHYLWKIDEETLLDQIKGEFDKMPHLYIADGHHRSASSHILAKESKAANPEHTGKESYNFFMSYLISERNLKIHEYSRLITDLNGLSKEEFLIKLDESFRIENHGMEVHRPLEKHHFNMYLDGEFYSLYLRKTNYEFGDSLSKLDPYILYKKVLQPILGIEDLRNDKRISYIHGKYDLIEIKSRIDKGDFAVSFGMLPLSIQEIKETADEGLIMPPKSTYIEPKLRSGLTIYEF
jgi:uncharacterized protein (DUF1015 family)